MIRKRHELRFPVQLHPEHTRIHHSWNEVTAWDIDGEIKKRLLRFHGPLRGNALRINGSLGLQQGHAAVAIAPGQPMMGRRNRNESPGGGNGKRMPFRSAPVAADENHHIQGIPVRDSFSEPGRFS